MRTNCPFPPPKRLVLSESHPIVASLHLGANLFVLVFRFAIVSPIDGHTKLQLEPEGLDIIRNLEGPFSPVVVIGPYRSGKSFLLNQLLGVGCGKESNCSELPRLHQAKGEARSQPFAICLKGHVKTFPN